MSGGAASGVSEGSPLTEDEKKKKIQMLLGIQAEAKTEEKPAGEPSLLSPLPPVQPIVSKPEPTVPIVPQNSIPIFTPVSPQTPKIEQNSPIQNGTPLPIFSPFDPSGKPAEISSVGSIGGMSVLTPIGGFEISSTSNTPTSVLPLDSFLPPQITAPKPDPSRGPLPGSFSPPGPVLLTPEPIIESKPRKISEGKQPDWFLKASNLKQQLEQQGQKPVVTPQQPSAPTIGLGLQPSVPQTAPTQFIVQQHSNGVSKGPIKVPSEAHPPQADKPQQPVFQPIAPPPSTSLFQQPQPTAAFQPQTSHSFQSPPHNQNQLQQSNFGASVGISGSSVQQQQYQNSAFQSPPSGGGVNLGASAPVGGISASQQFQPIVLPNTGGIQPQQFQKIVPTSFQNQPVVQKPITSIGQPATIAPLVPVPLSYVNPVGPAPVPVTYSQSQTGWQPPPSHQQHNPNQPRIPLYPTLGMPAQQPQHNPPQSAFNHPGAQARGGYPTFQTGHYQQYRPQQPIPGGQQTHDADYLYALQLQEQLNGQVRPSGPASALSQLDSDEALARRLQEEEDARQ